MSVVSAGTELEKLQIKYEIIGSGDIVLSQTPSYGNYTDSIETKIYLYTQEIEDYINVPSLIGKTAKEASDVCISLGLNLEITGAPGGFVVSQSLPMGALVPRGELIKLTVLVTDYED